MRGRPSRHSADASAQSRPSRPALLAALVAALAAAALLALGPSSGTPSSPSYGTGGSSGAGALIGQLAPGPRQALARKALPLRDENGNVIEPVAAEETEEEQDDSAPEPKYAADVADGTYYGDAQGFKSDVVVGVTVKGGVITSIEVISQSDDREYFDKASAGIIPAIISKQEPEVDAVAGASYSSRGIEHAVEDALFGDGAPDVARTMAIQRAEQVLAGVGAGAAVATTVWRAMARKRKARLAATRWQRFSIQAMFFLLAPSVFGSLFMGIKLPFDQIWHIDTFALSSFTVQLFVVLGLTVLIGRYFCGYACSFGWLGDIVYQLTDAVLKRLHVRRPQIPEGVERRLRYVKYVVLAGMLLAVFLGAMDFISENSPWTAFSRLSNFYVGGLTVLSVVLLVVIMVGMALKERSFCEFLCPLGALFSIIPTLPSGRVRWRRPTCYKGCSACHRACPVSIDPKSRVMAGECVGCGRCAEVCPAGNIRVGLDARLDAMGLEKVGAPAALPADPAEAKKARAKQSRAYVLHAAAPLVKALVFLAALWVMGVLKFLPAFPL